MMQETGIRRELEVASSEAAGASLRSAVTTATCVVCKDERAGAGTIVGCGAASSTGAFERLERTAGKLARCVLRGRDSGNAVSLPECAEHVQQFGGESPLPNLMEVKG